MMLYVGLIFQFGFYPNGSCAFNEAFRDLNIVDDKTTLTIKRVMLFSFFIP